MADVAALEDEIRRLRAVSPQLFPKPHSLSFRISVDDNRTTVRRVPVSTFLSTMMAPVAWIASKWPKKEVQTKLPSAPVLQHIEGYLRPGDCCVVLGSGKSTLMRILAGIAPTNNDGTHKIDVYVDDEPFDPMGLHRRLSALSRQDDALIPILTVKETFLFAARLNNSVDNLTEHSAEAIVATVMAALGLSHVADTVVGDATLRGVSGGQKRRVTVGERLLSTDTVFLYLDEPTNGLDAASALSLGTALRTANALFRATTMVSLLQPSPELLDQFNTMLILTEEGRLAYFGERSAALAYFASIGLRPHPKMPLPTFFSLVGDRPAQFSHADDTDWRTLSHSAADALLASRFAASSIAQTNRDTITTLRQRTSDHTSASVALQTTTTTTTKTTVPRPARFARCFREQVAILLAQQMRLIRRNPSSIMRIAQAIVVGLFMGTLFFQLPNEVSASVSIAGFLFTLLFLVSMNSMLVPAPDFLQQKRIFYSHREQHWYSTTAYFTTLLLAHLPLSVVENLLMCLTSYFIVGLTTSFSAFVIFILTVILGGLVGTALARSLAFSLPNEASVNIVGSALAFVMALVAGFSPQYSATPWVLRWLSWLNPVAYVYEVLVLNEFRGRTIVPTSGGVPIQASVVARDLLGQPRIMYEEAPAFLDSVNKVIWFDIGMLLVFIVVFELLAVWLMTRSRRWYASSTKRDVAQATSAYGIQEYVDETLPSVIAAGTQPLTLPSIQPVHVTVQEMVYEVEVKTPSSPAHVDASAPADTVVETPRHAEDESSGGATQATYGQAAQGPLRRLACRASGIAVTAQETREQSETRTLPPVAPGRLRLLSGVTASFAPGTLTALMGESGAGKSTLLDAIAGYKEGGHLSGVVRSNGAERHAHDLMAWRGVSGYCEQTDVHNALLTVRESLVFAASCRLAATVDDAVLFAQVERTLAVLDLREWASVIVGQEHLGQGLPKSVRKRLTIAVELVAAPSVLFLDEPTSGLDTRSAAGVMDVVQRAAREQQVTVLCTIHQPSRAIFEAFDRCLMLRRGGVVVYHGPIGEDSQLLLGYVRDALLKIGHAMSEEEVRAASERNPADVAMDVFCGGHSEALASLYAGSEVAQGIRAEIEEQLAHGKGAPQARERIGGWVAASLCFRRHLLAIYRMPSYSTARVLFTLVASLASGIVFFQMPLTAAGAFNRIGAVFFGINIATVPLVAAVVPLMDDRAVFYRESMSGTYRPWSYGVGLSLAELPFNVLCATLFFVLFYFMAGLRASSAGLFFFVSVLIYWLLPSLGQLFALLSPNTEGANGLASLSIVIFTLTMGFLIPKTLMPAWWSWLYWINPFHYLIEALAANELSGLLFVAPAGGNATASVSGDEVLATFSWSVSNIWYPDLFAVLLFLAAFEVLKVVLLTKVRWIKR